MFTRADIQYDLMNDIFNDRTFQFTSPVNLRPVCFKELYIETLSKCSKAAKNTIKNLDENPIWALNFSIASFLINIGRINTTVAFYPELRAYMRTYHPIPSLQPDVESCRETLQDAPRIKTMLKSCTLPYEQANDAASLPDIAKRSAAGYRPPTTVVNLLFEIFNVEGYVSSKYFPEGFALHDLFATPGIPTKLRAYAFLWLMHHFLEDPTAEQDFNTDIRISAFSMSRDGGIKNIDTEEELEWGHKMQAFRLDFLKKWRGEEGMSVEDLESTATPMTKRQKVIAANYQQAVEADIMANGGEGRNKAPTGAFVFEGEVTPEEGLRATAETLAKFQDDEEEPAPNSMHMVFKRIQAETAKRTDPVYDSEEEEAGVTWTSDELKGRLIGFSFPVDDGVDSVIRYGGKKESYSVPYQEESRAQSASSSVGPAAAPSYVGSGSA